MINRQDRDGSLDRRDEGDPEPGLRRPQSVATNAAQHSGPHRTPDMTTRAEPHPNAIIRLQRLRDDPADARPPRPAAAVTTGCGNVVSTAATDYWPNVLYDPREGTLRDDGGRPAPANADIPAIAVSGRRDALRRARRQQPAAMAERRHTSGRVHSSPAGTARWTPPASSCISRTGAATTTATARPDGLRSHRRAARPRRRRDRRVRLRGHHQPARAESAVSNGNTAPTPAEDRSPTATAARCRDVYGGIATAAAAALHGATLLAAPMTPPRVRNVTARHVYGHRSTATRRASTGRSSSGAR